MSKLTIGKHSMSNVHRVVKRRKHCGPHGSYNRRIIKQGNTYIHATKGMTGTAEKFGKDE